MVFFDTVDYVPHKGAVLVNSASRLGYSGVIFNESVVPPSSKLQANFKDFKSSIVKSQNALKEKDHPKISMTDIAMLSCSGSETSRLLGPNEMLQLTRCTVQISSPSQLMFLNSLARTNLYDLIAVTPHDGASWLALVSQGDFDVMSLDLTSARLPFMLKRASLIQLSRRNIFFEVRFNEALLDTQWRRNLFTNVQQLIRFVPHDKIILSSGASTPLHLRSPEDVVFLAQLMGVKELPKRVISDNVLGSIYKDVPKEEL